MVAVSLSCGRASSLQPSRVSVAKETKSDNIQGQEKSTDSSLAMVAFYVAFLALRSQDAGHPVEDIRDYELEGEREIYGG